MQRPQLMALPDLAARQRAKLSDAELVRELREGLADARAGQVFSAEQVAADLAVRRTADQ